MCVPRRFVLISLAVAAVRGVCPRDPVRVSGAARQEGETTMWPTLCRNDPLAVARPRPVS
jgi:hypothetical protein